MDTNNNKLVPLIKCGVCKIDLNYRNRISRGKTIKTLLFWLPIRRYQCNHCDKNYFTISLADDKVVIPLN